MFDSFWNDFKWKIFFSCFVPYLLYFSLAHTYFMAMLFRPDEESSVYEITTENTSYMATYEMPCRVVLSVLWLFHACV